jgi:hypothetical protein
MWLEAFNLWVVAERILYRHQQQFSINVWAGIVGDCSLGVHVLPHWLTDKHYWDFLLHDLAELLEYVPLPVRSQMWYMHDGAPAHFSCAVWGVRNNIHYIWWVGRGGPTAWPPRLPDLNPLDFYLWEHLKTHLYTAPVDNKEALYHHVVDACQTICNYQSIFEWMWWAMMRQSQGVNWISWKPFWALTYYKCNLSATTHVPWHMLIWTIFFVLVCGTHTQSMSTPYTCIYKWKNSGAQV